MSWATYPDRELAETICTQRELEVLRLRQAGYGQRRSARILNISREAVRYRLHAALDKIERAKGEAA